MNIFERPLSVYSGSSSEEAQQLLGKKRVTFPVLWDETSSLRKQYKIWQLPTTIVIDRDGIIRFYESGAVSEGRIREILAEMVLH